MAHNGETPIRVGLLGAGTVGSQTARLIVEQKDELSARIGRPIDVRVLLFSALVHQSMDASSHKRSYKEQVKYT